MAKGSKRVSVPMQAHLAILHNKSNGKNSDSPQPWCVILPSLGVSAILVDENGDSVTGYIEKSKASAMVQALANELTSDVEYLTTLRNSPHPAVLGSLYDRLGTLIHVPVFLPENFKV